MSRIGSGNIGHLILGDRGRKGFRIACSPSKDCDNAQPLEQFIFSQRFGNPIAIIKLVKLDLLAINAARVVYIMNRFGYAQSVIPSHVRCGAGHIVERTDAYRCGRTRCRRKTTNEQRGKQQYIKPGYYFLEIHISPPFSLESRLLLRLNQPTS